MRKILKCGCNAMLIGAIICSCARAADAPPQDNADAIALAEAMWPVPDTDQASAKVHALLETNIPELAGDQMPFEKAIGIIRQSSNANIFVNWTAIQGAGVDRNTPVTVDVHDVPYRKALMTVLSEVGGGQSNLGYTIDDGVITISTRDELQSAKYQVVRNYRVTEMLFPNGAADAGQFNDAIRELTGTITSTVAPDTWRDAGGTIGSIREFNGALIINQTVDNQEEIRKLLINLAALQIPVTRAYDVGAIIYNDSGQSKAERFKQLEELIVLHNSPNAWAVGGTCSISEFGGKLYISAPEPMQVKIKALLDLVTKNEAVR